MSKITLSPIAFVKSPRQALEDDLWGDITSEIALDVQTFKPEALAGLETFSHVEVLFYMDQVQPEKIELTARHPRNNTAWPKIGIFAQRGKNRPNQIGVTVCEIVRVDGLRLVVKGLDAVDGTPVLDLKPYMAEFGPRGPIRQPEWSKELMKKYFF